jgi:hypothetical protein
MNALKTVIGFAILTALVGAVIKLGVYFAELELSWRGAFGLAIAFWIVRTIDRAVWAQAEALEARKLEDLTLR